MDDEWSSSNLLASEAPLELQTTSTPLLNISARTNSIGPEADSDAVNWNAPEGLSAAASSAASSPAWSSAPSLGGSGDDADEPGPAPTSGNQAGAASSSNLNFNDSSVQNAAAAAAAESQDSGSRIVNMLLLTNLIVCLVGMCGNLIVILVILEFTRNETVNDIYILNLAFADLMFVTGLIFLIVTMHFGIWIFGNTMCKIFMSSTSINQFASSLLLVVMSFDRFLAVCHPIYAQRFRQPKRAKIICLCIWIVCLILQTPILIFARTDETMTCAIFWPESTSFNCERAFTLYSFAIGFASPLLLIALFYIRVLQRLRLAARVPMHAPSERRHRSNRRIERLVIVIILTYVICWMPYWLTQILISYMLGTNQPAWFWILNQMSASLIYTHSAINPILYAFLSDNFKRRCADVLTSIRLLRCCRRPDYPADSTQRLDLSQAPTKSVTPNDNQCKKQIKTSRQAFVSTQLETCLTSLMLESTPTHHHKLIQESNRIMISS